MTAITDWGTAVVSSLAAALVLVFAFIPKLIGFLVILLIGWLIASAIAKAVAFLLRKIGFDRMAQRIGLTRFEQRMGITMDAAGLLSRIVYWFIFLIFLVAAADALGVPTISNVLNTIVDYIPNVFVAILILFFGSLAATFVADLVRGSWPASVGNPNTLANIARYAIIGFVSIMALEQLQITPVLLNELFGAVVAAAALAFGLAFGLGGRETAQRWLNRGESTVSSAASQINAQQAQKQTYQQQVAKQEAYQQTYQQQTPSPYNRPQ